MLECPICKKETVIICDNGCGTHYCTCGLEFYYSYVEYVYIEGHHPGCIIDMDDTDDDDDSDSILDEFN